MRKAIIASMLLVAPLYAQNTVGGPPLLSCGPPESFISSSMNRELIIRARATSVSDRVVSSLDYTANMEVLEVLKGQFAAPAISVLIEDRRLAFRAGDEWLLALPGAGTRFIPRCGIFAVRIDSGNAIGRVESVDSEQSVPLERIRGVYRAPAR